MMKKRGLILLLATLLSVLMAVGADDPQTLRIVSYNLENLFDYDDDPLTDDNSFTPTGDHQWTHWKYWVKLQNLSKAITAAGGWDVPILIGMCEVENAKVVQDLLYKTQLKQSLYKFVHKDSPDRRGVDVALAYRPDEFRLIAEQFLPVEIENGKPTRDILHATGVLRNNDTLHVFVNHWPSRYGGELESEPNRMAAATRLRQEVEQLFLRNEKSKIVIMGDFNDYPDNESLLGGLCAQLKADNPLDDELYNLSARYLHHHDIGSHKFGGEWGMLDQIIVSGSLLNPNSSLHTQPDGMGICNEPFLLKADKTGFAPKRAFLGTTFAYGFSDHLPVFIDIILQNK